MEFGDPGWSWAFAGGWGALMLKRPPGLDRTADGTLAALRRAVGRLAGEVSVSRAEVEAARDELAAARVEVDRLRGEVGAVQADVGGLKDAITKRPVG